MTRTTNRLTADEITARLGDHFDHDAWDEVRRDRFGEPLVMVIEALVSENLDYSVGSDRTADVLDMAQRWMDATDAAEVSVWQDAGVFEPDAARALAAEGIDVGELTDDNRQPLHRPTGGDTVGYMVANGDLTAKQAVAIVRMVRGDSFEVDEAFEAIAGRKPEGLR